MVGAAPGPIVASLCHKYAGRNTTVDIFIHNPPLPPEVIIDLDRYVELPRIAFEDGIHYKILFSVFLDQT